MAIENLEFFSKFATLARVVVLPVPLIPTNTRINGSPVSFLAFIRETRSIVPAASKDSLMNCIRLCLTKFSMLFLSTFVPINFSFRLSLMESITSVATSDSSKLISS